MSGVAVIVRGRKEGEARVITADSADELAVFVQLANLKTYALRAGPDFAIGDVLVADVATVADDLERLGLKEEFAAKVKARAEERAELARREAERREQEAARRARERREAEIRAVLAEQEAAAVAARERAAWKKAEAELAKRERAGAS